MNFKPSFASILITSVTLFHGQAQSSQPAPSSSPGVDQIRLNISDVIARSKQSQAGIANDEQIVINVLGQVNKPSRLALPKTGTLLDAIASAGGFTKIANMSKVTVIHKSAGDKPDSASIDLKPILQGKAKDIALKDGDTVIVNESIF